jgi:predicted metal-dependent phosphoesterase TrpH
MEIDLHIHSKYSFDSILSPKKIFKVAKKRKLGGVAITDHNTIKGSIMSLHADVDGVVTIIGSEMGTEVGHILSLFLNEEIKSRTSLEVIDEIKAQDGIAVLAHPFKRTNEIDREILKKFDAVEVFNARTKKSANIKAMDFAKEYNMPVTAGSDAHFYFEIGRGRIIVPDTQDLEDIRKTILAKKVQIMGKESSKYIEIFSQSMKVFKTRRLPKRLHLRYNR